jgi:hypothetical protein
MAAWPVLVVVAIGDAVLRSALVRRLAMHGAEVLSVSGWNEALLRGPMIRPQSILIVDEAACEHAHSINREWEDGCWRRIVMLTASASDDGRKPLIQAERCAPEAVLSAVFAIETHTETA